VSLVASCLAHRERMFWQAAWSCWVHTSACQPCEAMAGDPDPTGWRCRYCGARLAYESGGRLWSFTGRGHHWEHTGQTCGPWSGGWEYIDDNWTDKCPVSPTFLHHVGPLRFTGVKHAG
jgi:hypothetical protein